MVVVGGEGVDVAVFGGMGELTLIGRGRGSRFICGRSGQCGGGLRSFQVDCGDGVGLGGGLVIWWCMNGVGGCG